MSADIYCQNLNNSKQVQQRGFIVQRKERGNRHVAVETERQRAWVCVHCEKMGLASIKEWMLHH